MEILKRSKKNIASADIFIKYMNKDGERKVIAFKNTKETVINAKNPTEYKIKIKNDIVSVGGNVCICGFYYDFE